MTSQASNHPFLTLERALALAAVAICLLLNVRVWQVISPQQPMWPLPGFYLFETAALSLLALAGIVRGDPLGSLAAWAVAGALLGFAILAGFSIGFYYLPVVAFLAFAALWLDRRDWRSLPLHVGIALIAAVIHAAFMLALIRMVYPSAVS